jgi:hypothetical protein
MMDLKTLCAQYQAYMETMDHWERLLPGRIHHVVYEDMAMDPERETRRIVCDILGLPWEPAVLQAHRCIYTLMVCWAGVSCVHRRETHSNIFSVYCCVLVVVAVQSPQGSAHPQHESSTTSSSQRCHQRLEKVRIMH